MKKFIIIVLVASIVSAPVVEVQYLCHQHISGTSTTYVFMETWNEGSMYVHRYMWEGTYETCVDSTQAVDSLKNQHNIKF